MQTKKFQKNIENFVCERCSCTVEGDGYTNHCPHCLWSKHVDINPGDRASMCNGIMEPIHVEIKGDGYTITHRCLQCGHEKKNKTNEKDNIDEVIYISTRQKIKPG